MLAQHDCSTMRQETVSKASIGGGVDLSYARCLLVHGAITDVNVVSMVPYSHCEKPKLIRQGE